MAKKKEFELDYTAFSNAMRDLSKLTGKSFKKVIQSEASAILKKTTKKTPPASTKKIQARYTYSGESTRTNRTPRTVIKYVTLDGKKTRVRSIKKFGAWRNVGSGKNKRRIFDKTARNPSFTRLKKVLAEDMKKAKAARGQSKATWLFIANRLRLPVFDVPAYVRKALGTIRGGLRTKLVGKEVGDIKYHILIENHGKVVMAPPPSGPGGYHHFKHAVDGRRKFFEQNLKKGVFKTVEKTAEKYPGLGVD
tara:strand:- start:308 stop:1057 length:750 start_codon:yes stop_codon:yes gene_type:complete